MNVRLTKFPWAPLIALTGLFALIYLSDLAYAATLLWPFCLGALLLAFLIVLPGLIWRRDESSLGLFAVFGAALVMLHFASFSPVKPFTRFYGDLHNGMTTWEVQQRLVQNFPFDGKFAPPVPNMTHLDSFDAETYGLPSGEIPTDTLSYVLDPHDGRYNAEVVLIYLKDDRIVGTSYLPD